jgi:hypothetical protein
MELATEEETNRFLNRLFFSWGQKIIQVLSKEYNLNEDQVYVLETKLLKPNDWLVIIQPPIHSS